MVKDVLNIHINQSDKLDKATLPCRIRFLFEPPVDDEEDDYDDYDDYNNNNHNHSFGR